MCSQHHQSAAQWPTFHRADFVEKQSHRPAFTLLLFFWRLKGVSGGGAHSPITQQIGV